jgi:hypothetical protein
MEDKTAILVIQPATDALGNVFLAGIGGSSPSLIARGGIKILIWGGGRCIFS